MSGISGGTGTVTSTSDKRSTVVKTTKKEDTVKSVGTPYTWTNWIGSWNDVKLKYGVSHKDTDMSNAQKLQNFKPIY